MDMLLTRHKCETFAKLKKKLFEIVDDRFL